jgi:N-acyl-L-homoserine lactone synthetase
MPAWLVALLNSGSVWAAIIAFLNIVIKYALPNMPAEILTAVNVLVVAILAAIGVQVDKAMRARGM